MRIITARPGAVIPLGRQGENLAVRVRFPAAEWAGVYGEGEFQLLARRPGEEIPYPVSVIRDGGFVCWDVRAADTSLAGSGMCELQYYVGDTLAKSQVYLTGIAPALDPPGPVPEPAQSWVEQVLQAVSEIREASGGSVSLPSWGSGIAYDPETRTISVDTVDAVASGEARPVSSNAVYAEIGNLNALLQSI
ncbi:MAG: hypothetical protein IJ705_03565 [Oscillospiraceae bacterium]|nr:hypothetical protein [Oscillospiraceae bacterium]